MAVLHNRISQEELKQRLFQETEPRTTVSFYRYFPIEDAGAFRDELYKDLYELKVFGRIYVAREGINAQLSVPQSNFIALKTYLYSIQLLSGVRLNIAGEQAAWLSDGTADWFWPAAEKAGVPVMFLTNGQTHLFGPIAERHPQLTLIIDHMGVSSEALKDGKLSASIDQSAALAKYPNVSVKLSASPLFSSEPYPFRDMAPSIRKLYDAYGPQRCHWGTDVTNSFAKASYRQRVTHFTEELPFLSEDDKDWIMGRAIVERLKWA